GVSGLRDTSVGSASMVCRVLSIWWSSMPDNVVGGARPRRGAVNHHTTMRRQKHPTPIHTAVGTERRLSKRGEVSRSRSPMNYRTFGARVRQGNSVRLAIDSSLLARGHLSGGG